MQKSSYLVLCAVLAAGCLTAKLAVAADAKKEAQAPETIKMDKVGKLQPVVFLHAEHGKLNTCKDCHEGDKPLFPKKRSADGMKMSDMKAGKGCGSCHDGKKTFGKDKKKVFASTMCMKCHKPAAAK